MKFLHHFRIIPINDIETFDEDIVIHKVNNNARFSFSFLILLTSSGLICTLGLLLNSAPVVIGGMIIAPLMWPLIKTAIGISYEEPKYIRDALVLLIIAVAVTFFSSALITYISPIKTITSQILAGTRPTLLDLIIALAAGAVAALGITQKRISESLAGVAIATSLMPPLCVSGIGLALAGYQTFSGGFLLFFSNAIAIIFAAVLVFSFIGARRKRDQTIRRTGAYVLIGMIIVTAIPLYFYLDTYSFKLTAYQRANDILQKSFAQISPEIVVNNITTDFTNQNTDSVSIEAQVLLPEDIAIDYTEQQKIITALQNAIHKKINLKLDIQRTISILSEKDMQYANTKQQLQKVFLQDITAMGPALSVDSVLINNPTKGNTWDVNAVLRGDPSTPFTETDRLTIQKDLTSAINAQVALNIQFIPTVKLLSKQSVEDEKITQYVQDYLNTNILANNGILTSVNVSQNDGKTNQLRITIELKVPVGTTLSKNTFINLKRLLAKEFKKSFTLQVDTIGAQTTLF